jgi:hypothetical protein
MPVRGLGSGMTTQCDHYITREQAYSGNEIAILASVSRVIWRDRLAKIADTKIIGIDQWDRYTVIHLVLSIICGVAGAAKTNMAARSLCFILYKRGIFLPKCGYYLNRRKQKQKIKLKVCIFYVFI